MAVLLLGLLLDGGPSTHSAELNKMAIIKRSIILNGRKTSVSLEDEFWAELRAIAVSKKIPLTRLVQKIDETRAGRNLSSAIRVFVLKQLGA